MRIALGWKSISTQSMMIVLMAAMASYAYLSVKHLVAFGVVQNHAAHLLREYEILLGLVANAEAGQRGYLLTGDKRYLTPYDEAVETIPLRLELVKQLVISEPKLVESLDSLQKQIEEKLGELKVSIMLRKNDHLTEAMLNVVSHRGLAYMGDIRARISDLKDRAEDERNQAAAQIDDSLDHTINAICGGSLLGILVILGSAAGTNAELLERRRAERNLKKTEGELTDNQKRLTEIIATQNNVAMSGLDLATVMNAIAERSQSLTGATGAVVEIADGEEMTYRAVAGTASDKLGFKVKIKGSLSGYTMASGELQYCKDTETDSRVDRDACRRIGVASMVVMPLKYRNGTLGVLKVYSDRRFAFAERDFETLRLLAGLLSSTMANAVAFEERRDAEKRANESSRYKSEFLANMSHEIRTPLNGIVGMATLLIDTPLQGEQKEFLENIMRSADALLTIINDILDFSKVEAGKLDIENVEFDLDAVVSDLGKTMSFAARKKGLEFNVQSMQWVNHFVGDPGRVRQVALNLLSNAIKFTQRGSVRFEISTVEKTDDVTVLRFAVVDSGIGMSRETQDKLFQPFSQADASTTRRYGGTGLGLSISRSLVSLMGGEIGVTSQEGTGSTFWFTLPFKMGTPLSTQEIKPMEPEQKAPDIADRKRILVAEDSFINQRVAIGMLERLHYRATAVGNGVEVIKALEEIRYDLVLMDCQMPEMDGYDATKAIRASSSVLWRDIPIIAMTANAIKGDRERCMSVGMNDYISKPIKIDALSKTLSRWLGTESIVVAPPQEISADTRFNLEAMRQILELESGSPKLLNELAQAFFSTTPERLSAMRTALSGPTSDSAAVSKIAHSLKSSSASIGLSAFSSLCAQLEADARNNKDVPILRDLVTRLDKELAVTERKFAEVVSGLTHVSAA